jgi:hypothetical protein
MNTIHRALMLFAIALVFICFSGGRCYGDTAPLMIRLQPQLIEDGYLYEARSEKPPIFMAKGEIHSRAAVNPVICPRSAVPVGYHPQPAHC